MDFPSATTTQLLDALGDNHQQDVWIHFDRRYRPILRAVARRTGLTEEESCDVAQETLLEFFRDFRLGRYERGKGRLRSWIMRIAHNRAIDAMRARQRRRIVGGDSALEIMPDGTESEPDLNVWDQERRRAIFDESMRRLREESNTSQATLRAFELTAIRGIPAEAAAAETGLSVDQVYVARSRTARKLKQIVDAMTAAFDDDA